MVQIAPDGDFTGAVVHNWLNYHASIIALTLTCALPHRAEMAEKIIGSSPALIADPASSLIWVHESDFAGGQQIPNCQTAPQHSRKRTLLSGTL